MRFLLLTGLSGAGKTSATRYLEDMGVFCVDNLPPMMMLKLMEACQSTAMHCPLVAFAVDVRSGEFFDAKAVQRLITETRGLGYQIETLFMEASDDVLVSRYKETRRDHPLASESVSLIEAIAQEREMLTPLRETANYVIDTSFLRPRALQRKLAEIVKSDGGEAPLRLEVLSFGFKRGLPRQGDLVFDVRFLPNPFYMEELCHHTGLDAGRAGLCDESPRYPGIHGQGEGHAHLPAPPLSGGGQAPAGHRRGLHGRRPPERGHCGGHCGIHAPKRLSGGREPP